MSYFDSHHSHQSSSHVLPTHSFQGPHESVHSPIDGNSSPICVNPAALSNGSSPVPQELRQFQSTLINGAQFALSPTHSLGSSDSPYLHTNSTNRSHPPQQDIPRSDPREVFRGPNEYYDQSFSNTATTSLVPDDTSQFGRADFEDEHRLFAQFTVESLHQPGFPSSSTWTTEPENQRPALPSVSLSLPPFAKEFVAIAHASHCPPKVVILQNGDVELTFDTYNDSLKHLPSAAFTDGLPRTTISNPSSVIEAFQDYQEVQQHRRIHSTEPGERHNAPKYRCTLLHGCTKSFKTKRDWKRHEETHFPQKLWVCSHERCQSWPPKQRAFLRRELFKQHHLEIHDHQTKISTQMADGYMLTVLGSKWPRECPFTTCHRNNFLSFDDRLEHIAKEHFDKKKAPVGNGNGSSNGDEDQDGSNGAFSGGSRNTGSQSTSNSSHGPHHSNSGTSGGGSSGKASSFNFPYLNGAHLTYERFDDPKLKPTGPSDNYDKSLALPGTLPQQHLAKSDTNAGPDKDNIVAGAVKHSKITGHRKPQTEECAGVSRKRGNTAGSQETKNSQAKQSRGGKFSRSSKSSSTRVIPPHVPTVMHLFPLDSTTWAPSECAASTTQTFVSRTLESSVKQPLPDGKVGRTPGSENLLEASCHSLTRWLGEPLNQQPWTPIKPHSRRILGLRQAEFYSTDKYLSGLIRCGSGRAASDAESSTSDASSGDASFFSHDLDVTPPKELSEAITVEQMVDVTSIPTMSTHRRKAIGHLLD